MPFWRKGAPYSREDKLRHEVITEPVPMLDKRGENFIIVSSQNPGGKTTSGRVTVILPFQGLK